MKQKQYYNKFKKGFENGPHKKQKNLKKERKSRAPEDPQQVLNTTPCAKE